MCPTFHHRIVDAAAAQSAGKRRTLRDGRLLKGFSFQDAVISSKMFLKRQRPRKTAQNTTNIYLLIPETRPFDAYLAYSYFQLAATEWFQFCFSLLKCNNSVSAVLLLCVHPAFRHYLYNFLLFHLIQHIYSSFVLYATLSQPFSICSFQIRSYIQLLFCYFQTLASFSIQFLTILLLRSAFR